MYVCTSAVLMAENIKIAMFWDLASCSLDSRYENFEEP